MKTVIFSLLMLLAAGCSTKIQHGLSEHDADEIQAVLGDHGITAAPIRIERNVWLGAGAIVLQGVTVGEGAVVGAGSVVSRDVPPATLVAGAPATVVRSLDDG